MAVEVIKTSRPIFIRFEKERINISHIISYYPVAGEDGDKEFGLRFIDIHGKCYNKIYKSDEERSKTLVKLDALFVDVYISY